MTLQMSLNGRNFEVFVEHFLLQTLWEGAVVVRDNLPAHKLRTIEPLIQVAGASLLKSSPYLPDFNPIELWWSQLKSFLRQFSSSTTKIDIFYGRDSVGYLVKFDSLVRGVSQIEFEASDLMKV